VLRTVEGRPSKKNIETGLSEDLRCRYKERSLDKRSPLKCRSQVEKKGQQGKDKTRAKNLAFRRCPYWKREKTGTHLRKLHATKKDMWSLGIVL